MTLPLTIDVEFIEPASYVLHNAYKYVYLCDPIGEGDHRVGKIVKCPYSGMFYMQWIMYCSTILWPKIIRYIYRVPMPRQQEREDWWHKYHTPEEDSDHEYYKHPQTSVEVGAIDSAFNRMEYGRNLQAKT